MTTTPHTTSAIAFSDRVIEVFRTIYGPAHDDVLDSVRLASAQAFTELAASAPVAPTVEGAIAQLKTALCESKGWAKNYSDALIRDAIDRVEPAPQPAAPQWDGDMLRAHAEGRVTHINNGLCPDIIEGHDTRDPECPVCQALLENHAALPAPTQGAAKEE